MPSLKPAYFWEAKVSLEINNMAFSLQTKDEGMGAYKKRIFYADWLKEGKIIFNPAQRVSGWLRKQLPLIRSTYREQVQAIKVFPTSNELWESIADAKDLIGTSTPPEDNMEYPKELCYPFKQHIVVDDGKGGTRTTTTYWLVLSKPIIINVNIMSFARSIVPEMIEEALKELGKATGIGDKYSQGFGTFNVISFKAEQKRLAL
jgi:hypothetical protein